MTDPSCIPAVRSQIEQAEEKLQIAAKLLRQHGYTDNADGVASLLKQARVYTQKGGWLDMAESALEWPEENQ